MTAPAASTLFIAEHDDSVAEMLQQAAHALSLQMQRFRTTRELYEHFDPEQPGCLVLDAELPDETGLLVQRRLRAEGVQTPTVLVARQAQVSVVVEAMRNGAVDFLEVSQLNERLAECLRRAVELDRQRRHAAADRRQIETQLALLTVQERQVADCMAAGMSIKEIAARLDISQRTVHLRQASILAKLKLESTADLLLWMLRDVAGR